jgi:hypothetical protein
MGLQVGLLFYFSINAWLWRWMLNTSGFFFLVFLLWYNKSLFFFVNERFSFLFCCWLCFIFLSLSLSLSLYCDESTNQQMNEQGNCVLVWLYLLFVGRLSECSWQSSKNGYYQKYNWTFCLYHRLFWGWNSSLFWNLLILINQRNVLMSHFFVFFFLFRLWWWLYSFGFCMVFCRGSMLPCVIPNFVQDSSRGYFSSSTKLRWFALLSLFVRVEV